MGALSQQVTAIPRDLQLRVPSTRTSSTSESSLSHWGGAQLRPPEAQLHGLH